MSMKKIFAVLALGVTLILPLSASAISQLTDSEMSVVIGQSGVSIIMDVRMDIHFDVLAWGDADGIGTVAGTTGGWVGLSNLNVNGLRIRYIPEKLSSMGFSYNCWK